jgi:multidrug efflux pump subunit AcrA (membrane-fusion protein)
MALKLIIDRLDDVDESLRSLYEEKDGKFHLNVDGIEDNTQIKADLRKANKEAADRRRELEAWKKSGKSPEEIEELIAAAARLEEEKLKGAGDWDKLKAQMNEKHEQALRAKDAVIATKDAEVSAMRKSLERHLIKAQATAEIAANKGEPELLLPVVERFMRVNEDNGNYSTQIVDEKGDPRVDAKGNPLSLSALMTELRANEKYGRAFEGSGHSGGGMPPGNGSGGGIPQNKRRSDFKSEKERAAFVDEHGIAAYQGLPA